jgi:hypothetical protein
MVVVVVVVVNEVVVVTNFALVDWKIASGEMVARKWRTTSS